MTEVSEYEAKRLRRIEENRKKLQSLHLPTLATSSPTKPKHKKRKRDVEEKPLEPTRKSSRQRKKRKVERQQWKEENQEHKPVDRYERKRLDKLEKKKLKQLKKEKKLEKRMQKELRKKSFDEEQLKRDQSMENGPPKYINQQLEQQPRILDWRLRRKLQAQVERRQATLKRREDRKIRREKEKVKKMKLEKKEKKLKKKQKEKERLERLLQVEIEKQEKIEELQLMREEDCLAQQWAKQQAREAKQKQLQEKCAAKEQLVVEMLRMKEEKKRATQRNNVEALDQKKYPIRQINLPFVRLSDAKAPDQTKPVVQSPLLKVDPNLFHMFSLGKQFLPPGKKAVMQGMCPGGYTADFRDNVDIHEWKNAMTLFMNSTTGMFYQYMFEEVELRGRKHVFFRWSRCQHVTQSILERLCRVQKGEELLRFGDNYYDTPSSGSPSIKREPLLLFVQYPKGPYIYCGRLGFLGYRSNPLEFTFQLLDTNALNWRQIKTRLTSC